MNVVKHLTASLLCGLLSLLFTAIVPCDGKKAMAQNATNSPKFESTTQLSQRDSPIVARVLSTDPFLIETVEDPTKGSSAFYAPRPISRNIQHSTAEIMQLRYGDIITGRVYSYLYDAGELALGTGIRNIRKLGEQAKAKYNKKGFLLSYARLTNTPNSYLTIYRDGTILCQDTPGNYIENKILSNDELKKLISEFEAEGINDLPFEAKLKEFDPALISSIGKYQQLGLANPSPNLKRFLARLDSLIDKYINSATYRITYYRRFLIKDWPYENIIALDEITDSFGNDYRYKHQARLSLIKPSASFIEETVETCKDSCFLYQYKNKLYAFYLLNSCTDETGGTWACFRATELAFGKIDSTTNWGYIDWPTDVGVRLSEIPKDGLDIPADEYIKHSAFYTRLLTGSRFMYKEGNYIYQGINTLYH